MTRKNKIFKSLSVFTTVVVLLSNCLTTAVLAQEAEAEATPTPVPANEIDTGDAAAEATTDTTANINVDEVPGALDTGTGTCPDPAGETTCPEEVVITNNNEASVAAELDTGANTGENTSVAALGDAEITTGDATASGEMDTTLNVNIVEFTATESAAVAAEATEAGVAVTVENTNQAEVKNEESAAANSGANAVTDSLGNAQVVTGDATALANLVNVMNANIVGSNFKLLSLDILEDGDGDINLNEIWKNILSIDGEGNITLTDGSTVANLKLRVMNENMACLENGVEVDAQTGGNLAAGNDNASIQTGNAAAMANVVNIVNMNILGTKFFLGNINILSNWRGNLILPRPEFFPGESTGSGQMSVDNDNLAEVTNNLTTGAESGENTEIGNAGGYNIITTGPATAFSNSLSIINTTMVKNNWFFLLINNLGGWQGKVYNWSSPGSVETPGEGVMAYELNPFGGMQSIADEEPSGWEMANFNSATVVNNINVNAVSGENGADFNRGATRIQTGSAKALANLFNLINTNIIGGRWFLGSVNVLGGWGGDAIYAYPDVAVGISADRNGAEPGDTLEYRVKYRNSGYETATGSQLKLGLPDGVEASCAPVGCTWELGSLKPGQEGTFPVYIKIKDDFSFADAGNSPVWERMIPAVYAQDDRKTREIKVSAYIFTPDPDTNLSNNNNSAEAVIYEKIGDPNIKDQRQPKLEIEAVNNANGWVYTGDTVTFDIKIKNTSDVAAFNAYLIQDLYTQNGTLVGAMRFELGTVEAGKGGTLNFGLKVPTGAPAGTYVTAAIAYGTATNGNLNSSNESKTSFGVRTKWASLIPEAKAEEDMQVLSAQDWNVGLPGEIPLWPYILLLAGSVTGLTGESLRLWKRYRTA